MFKYINKWVCMIWSIYIIIILCNAMIIKEKVDDSYTFQFDTVKMNMSSNCIEPIKSLNIIYDDTQYYNIPLNDELQYKIYNVCKFYNFNEEIIYQMMYRESKFNSFNNINDCKGILAINTNYIYHYMIYDDIYDNELIDFDIFDAYQNTIIAVRILDSYRKRYALNDIKKILEMYNKGCCAKNYKKYPYANWVLSVQLEKYTKKDTIIINDLY